jgi:hypothetical protein
MSIWCDIAKTLAREEIAQWSGALWSSRQLRFDGFAHAQILRQTKLTEGFVAGGAVILIIEDIPLHVVVLFASALVHELHG